LVSKIKSEIDMLKEFKGKNVTVYLTVTPWGNSEVKGEVVESNESWLKLKTKRSIELIKLETIKRVSVHT
jgi:hypothetical protein